MESHESSQEPTPEIDEITPEERRKTTTLAAALAAAGGLVLLISLVLPWYKDDVSNLPEQVRSGVDLDTYTAFSGLERTDVLLAIVAIAAIAAAAAALTPILRDLGLLGWTLCDRGSGGAARHLPRQRAPGAQGGVRNRDVAAVRLVSGIAVVTGRRGGGVVALRKAHAGRAPMRRRLARRGGRRGRARARGAGRRRAGGRRGADASNGRAGGTTLGRAGRARL